MLEIVEWKDGQLPILDGKGWHRLKTIDSEGSIWRAEILWIRFIRNSWNHLVRVEFEYKMESYITNFNSGSAGSWQESA